jgi:PhnB protein
MAKLNPYLSFENCREAMNFYKECLGGELVLQTVGESPAMAAQMPPEMRDHILHSTLTVGDIVIMASDMSKGKRMEGNTVQLCINCDSETQIADYFSKLSAGGTIDDPLIDMPWGAIYGAITDKYGKHWVLNFQKG